MSKVQKALEIAQSVQELDAKIIALNKDRDRLLATLAGMVGETAPLPPTKLREPSRAFSPEVQTSMRTKVVEFLKGAEGQSFTPSQVSGTLMLPAKAVRNVLLKLKNDPTSGVVVEGHGNYRFTG
jgi:hypothetical protein